MTQPKIPTVALFGLPNSGKSTLLNRLTESKKAIVAREAHTTRDINYGEVEWDGYYFKLVDTGGLVPDPKDKIQKQIQIKSWVALEQADILVWVIDRKQNPETIHESIIQRVWKTGKPVTICINKVDDPNMDASVGDYAHLGGFDFVNISATTSYGTDKLLDGIIKKMGELGFEPVSHQELPSDQILDSKYKKKKSKKLTRDKEGNFVVLRENTEDGPGLFYSSQESQIVNPIDNIITDIGGVVTADNIINEEYVEQLKSLKESGASLYYLTTFTQVQLDPIIEKLPDLFDGGLCKDDTKWTKPDPYVYRELAEKYNFEPSKSIFIDDSQTNVVAAREVGFFGIHYLYGKTNISAIYEEIISGQLNKIPNPPKVLFIGKPNVGKSSLFNSMIGEEIQIVTDVAGTTISVNDTLLNREVFHNFRSEDGFVNISTPVSKDYVLLDSTGVRKPGQRTMGAESFATFRTIQAAHESDVICLIMDATTPLTHQDQVVAGICQEAGKGIVLVINKMDIVDAEQKQAFLKSFHHKFAFLKIDNTVFVSAKENIGMRELWQSIDLALEDRKKTISREQVRKLFNYLMKKKRPNKLRNKKRPVIYDLLYKQSSPPTFELLVKDKEAIHWSWVRFLENQVRRQFRFTASGVKIKLVEVDRKNVAK